MSTPSIRRRVGLAAPLAVLPALLLAGGSPFTPAASSSQAVDCSGFAAVQAVRAQLAFSFQAAGSFVSANDQCSYQVSNAQSASITADLIQTTQSGSQIIFEGPVQGHVAFDDDSSRTCPPASPSRSATIRANGSGPPIIPGGCVPDPADPTSCTPKLSLIVDIQQCTYEVNAGFFVSGTWEVPGSSGGQITLPVDIGTGFVGSGQQPVGDPQDRIQFSGSVPAYYGTTTPPFFFPVSSLTASLGELVSQSGPDLGTASVSWSFDPEELELVVDPENYDTWMPEGVRAYSATSSSAAEDQIGTTIDVEATVRRTSDGLPPRNSAVQSVDFVLVQSSAEPGIALNTPPQSRLANPQKKDLQFDPALNAALQPAVTVSTGDTSRAQASQGVTNTATAKLSAHDWGAFGELEVSATLDSGYVLKGHLISDPNMKRIRLPKRDANSHIADEWKRQHGVATKADSEDDEDNPGGSGQHLGDGLSLYEEYRGFFVGGKHTRGDTKRETDPNEKDLFVKNDYGPVLVPGFKLLASGGRLRIHHELLDEEIDAGSVVNYNDGQGAHVVEQHGVRVVQGSCGKNLAGHAVADPNAGASAGCPSGECLRLLPRTTTQLCVAPQVFMSGTSIYRRPPQHLQRTVAHELAHAISVDHHGETDLREVKWVLDPATNGVTEHSRNGSYPIEIRAESGSGALNAQELADLFALASSFAELEVYVGSARGEHGGAHDCFMRYGAASAYTLEPAQQATPRVRWWAGSEQAGTGMDASASGSGVNAASRMPRSRYGDSCSSLERGDCRHQIRVSDALPDLVLATNGGAQCP